MYFCFIFKKMVQKEFKTIEHKNNQEHHSADLTMMLARMKLTLGCRCVECAVREESKSEFLPSQREVFSAKSSPSIFAKLFTNLPL